MIAYNTRMDHSEIQNVHVECQNGFDVRPNHAGNLTYRLARCRQDRKDAFRLVYQAYREKGLIAPKSHQMRVLPSHLSSSSAVFVARHHDQTIYTMSLLGADETRPLPLEDLYGRQVERFRDQGIRVAEVSCLASQQGYFKRKTMFDVFVRLVGLMFQYARHNGIDQLLIAVHPRHARFYERFLGFTRFGAERAYASMRGNPAVGCLHDFARMDEQGYPLYDQVYQSLFSPSELTHPWMPERDYEYFLALAEPDSRARVAVPA